MTNTVISVVVIMLGLAYGIHFSKISQAEHEKIGHGSTSNELQAHASMDHGSLEVPEEIDLPAITHLEVSKDPMSGWNVSFETINFTFAPELASLDHQNNKGHAHIYVNGNKVSRLYGHHFHLPEFIKDENEIKVTLNSNDHRILTYKGSPIEKIVVISKNG